MYVSLWQTYGALVNRNDIVPDVDGWDGPSFQEDTSVNGIGQASVFLEAIIGSLR